MYNPETCGWHQCDEETYDSSMSPEEQLIDTMRTALATVPSYCERYQRAADIVRKNDALRRLAGSASTELQAMEEV